MSAAPGEREGGLGARGVGAKPLQRAERRRGGGRVRVREWERGRKERGSRRIGRLRGEKEGRKKSQFAFGACVDLPVCSVLHAARRRC